MNKNTLMNLVFTTLCVLTVMTSCFDCVVSLATAAELKAGSEQNPIWASFLEDGTVRSMVGLKFMGVFAASLVMYAFRNDRLRFHVMIPRGTLPPVALPDPELRGRGWPVLL